MLDPPRKNLTHLTRSHPSIPSTTGLITRSVLKALATEGVTAPHHARRFLLQQCRAVADEVRERIKGLLCVLGRVFGRPPLYIA